MKPVVKHWQDPANAVLGAWLILAPWVLGFDNHTTALANAVATGGALLAVGVAAVFEPRPWEQWIELVLGVWLIASPWALKFSALTTVTNAMVVTGVLIAVLAAWRLFGDTESAGWSDKARQQ